MTAVAAAPQPSCAHCNTPLEANGTCWACDSEFTARPAAPVRFDLAAIEARFHAGTLTDVDVLLLIDAVKSRPTITEALALGRRAEAKTREVFGL